MFDLNFFKLINIVMDMFVSSNFESYYKSLHSKNYLYTWDSIVLDSKELPDIEYLRVSLFSSRGFYCDIREYVRREYFRYFGLRENKFARDMFGAFVYCPVVGGYIPTSDSDI